MRDHFCPDGFLKGDGYDADTLTVLFVFRESNISDDVTLEDGQITLKQGDGTDKAWLKKQWDKVEGSERKDPYVSFMEQYVSFIEQHWRNWRSTKKRNTYKRWKLFRSFIKNRSCGI